LEMCGREQPLYFLKGCMCSTVGPKVYPAV
jgi:hypothetical protein